MRRCLLFVGLFIWVLITASCTKETAESHFEAGKIYLEKKQIFSALREFRRASHLTSQDTQILENLAYTYALCGNIKKSIATYEKLLILSPNAKTCYNLALLYKQEKDVANLRFYLTRALYLARKERNFSLIKEIKTLLIEEKIIQPR